MARKPMEKSGLALPTSSSFVGPPSPPSLVSAMLCKVTEDGSIDSKDNRSIFLLNPDSYEENKTSNWSAHAIPGQSDPVLQWTHGGARTLSFEALVTNDTKYYNKPNSNPLSQLASEAITAVGSIASSFAGVNIPTSFLANALFGGEEAGSNSKLDISKQLDYYRSLLYPVYNEAGELESSPPLVVLYVNNSLDTNPNFSNGKGGKVTKDTTVWAVTDLNIKITKQLSSLAPMEALVGFKMTQYMFNSRNSLDVAK